MTQSPAYDLERHVVAVITSSDDVDLTAVQRVTHGHLATKFVLQGRRFTAFDRAPSALASR